MTAISSSLSYNKISVEIILPRINAAILMLRKYTCTQQAVDSYMTHKWKLCLRACAWRHKTILSWNPSGTGRQLVLLAPALCVCECEHMISSVENIYAQSQTWSTRSIVARTIWIECNLAASFCQTDTVSCVLASFCQSDARWTTLTNMVSVRELQGNIHTHKNVILAWYLRIVNFALTFSSEIVEGSSSAVDFKLSCPCYLWVKFLWCLLCPCKVDHAHEHGRDSGSERQGTEHSHTHKNFILPQSLIWLEACVIF